MTNFLKRLMQDRRGNVLAMTAAAMPLLLGSVGLATDTIQWALWKRQLQRAADSAAFAGVYAKFHETGVNDAVNLDLSRNNHVGITLESGYPIVAEPADTSTFMNAVEVSLAVKKDLSFSSMFMDAAPTVIVNARAGAVDDGWFCVVALEPTNNSGIIIQGNATVNMGCGMISNSPAASISVGVNGTAHYVTAEPVAGVGGVPDINGVTKEQSGHLPQPDPFKNKYPTNVPAGMNCTNMNQKIVTPAPTAGVTTLSPGCYTGNNQFKITNGTYHLQPGVYYLDGTDLDLQGGTITGTDVTIILTGTTPGQIKLNANATIQLKAPTTGTYANMLLIQSANATNSNNANIINGSATSSLDGTIYIPNQQVTFSGTAGAMTRCAMVVARRVEFAGNTNLQNNTTGCSPPPQIRGKTIKLLA